MKHYNEKSVHTLELPRVLEQLADHAVSAEAKRRAMELRPETNIDTVTRMQRETTDAKRLIGMFGAPAFAGIRDVKGALQRADMGGTLNLRELLDVAMLLNTARRVRGYLDENGRVETCLHDRFDSLSANKYLEEMITTAILSEDEVADQASSELADIRKKIRASNAKIREVLQHMISSPSQSKYLQEAIITQRGGRYVVPVKSEYKNDVGGMVHDVSATGATVFIEPASVVKINNDLRELAGKEEREIERILATLSAEVSTYSESIGLDYDILVALDLLFAKAKLSYAQNADAPVLNEKGEVLLKEARHPLLASQKTVPISVRLGRDFDTLVITGPNTGGKTVTLKTIGLLTLMAECGLHIPAQSGSEISVFETVYADIGDEQSIEQSLSTFSSHMVNIVEILETADDRSLILFDELGAGTDPVEGAAIAVAIIRYAMALGARLAVTTHYTELKSFALTTNRVENASCEFDVETLQPTYKLLIGVPGKSNAFAIAHRLGLSDHIIDTARDLVDSENQQFDKILQKLEEKRTALEAELSAAEALKRENEELNRKAREYDERLERDRARAQERVREEAEEMLKEARRAADKIFDEIDALRKAQKKKDDIQRINEARASLRGALNEGERKLGSGKGAKRAKAEPLKRPLQIGDTVELLAFGTQGTVLTLPDADGNLRVQAGVLKVTTKVSEIRLIENAENRSAQKIVERSRAALRNQQMSNELDLRGMASDEAIMELDRYLDQVFLAKLSTVRIIHGKGTGVLRAAVQSHLRKHPHVKSFRIGTFGEGENGVTVVEIRQ
ncbi:MAG: endonuclease MutS2 [Ruminococcaceae bacterium]|nr:endonuclease MutS2 [Oscillospiraceae bacterium]